MAVLQGPNEVIISNPAFPFMHEENMELSSQSIKDCSYGDGPSAILRFDERGRLVIEISSKLLNTADAVQACTGVRPGRSRIHLVLPRQRKEVNGVIATAPQYQISNDRSSIVFTSEDYTLTHKPLKS